MATFDYARLGRRATVLLTKYGQDGTVSRRGAATGPSYAPTYGPDTTHAFKGVLDRFTAKEREGTSILDTDTKIIASTMDIDPTPADTLTIGGDTFDIMRADPVKPGGVVLIWEIWARKTGAPS